MTTFKIIRGGRLLDIAAGTADAADILIEGDTIRETGAPGLAAPEGAQAVDASGRLMMPGLVNAHTHGHGSLGKGLGDRWSLELLLNAGPWTSGSHTLEDKYLSALINAAEMVLKGSTACYDLYFEFPVATLEGLGAVGRGYADVGVRAVLAPMMADTLLYDAIPGLRDALPAAMMREIDTRRAAPAEAHVAALGGLFRGWSMGRDEVRLALAPTIPLHCSDAFIVACRDLAREHGVGLHMHLAESKVQAISGIKRYGKTLAAHLDDLGLLGPDFTGAHCVWLDDDDMKRMAANGASVAHNPGSNLRLGSGIAPARAMAAHGINVGIGTDGSSCSDNQNMFEALRIASFVSRVSSADPATWLGTADVLGMATEGGARLLGFAGAIGRVAPGYKADIVFLDLGNINFVPLNDAANQVVNCEDSSAVEDVMIGGRMVLEGRRFTTLDYEKLKRDAAAAVARLAAANAPTRAFQEGIAGLVGAHCIGLARQPYPVRRLLDGAG